MVKGDREIQIKTKILKCVADHDHKLHQKQVAVMVEIHANTVSTYVRMMKEAEELTVDEDGPNHKLSITTKGRKFLKEVEANEEY